MSGPGPRSGRRPRRTSKTANALVGDTNHVLLVDELSTTYGHNRVIATIGVTDLVIVDTADAVLVAAKDQVQDVKGIVNRLNERCASLETELHREATYPALG